jgi:hypothetical protein
MTNRSRSREANNVMNLRQRDGGILRRRLTSDKPPEDIAIRFLQKLRYHGPWVLSAIVPDDTITTFTAKTPEEVREFVKKYNGKRNLYYTVNLVRRAMDSKPKKTDIAAVEYLHADFDPRDDERPEQAKQRYQENLAKHGLQPTMLVNSGNGFNALWRLSAQIPPDRFAEVEACNLALVKALGGPPGTQNVDRILRLPGTMNLPTERKRKAGRGKCHTGIVALNDLTYTLDQFLQNAVPVRRRLRETTPKGTSPSASSHSPDEKRLHEARLPPKLLHLVRSGIESPHRSDQFFRAVAWLKRLGWHVEAISTLLGRYPDGIAAKYAGRLSTEVERAFGKADDDKADKADGKDEDGGKQTDVLIALAQDADLFHTDDAVAFASIEVDGHWETWPVRSSGLRLWLLHRYYRKTKGAPNREAMNGAVGVLESRARFDGQCHQVHVRTAGHDGRIYIDLCDDKWRAVEIDTRGWRLVDRPPVRFTRGRGMLPLPQPVEGGTVHDLRRFLNIKNDSDFVLVISWLIATLRDHGPYPILTIRGEEGTGKSTLVRCLRALVDPNKVGLRALPREERDLYIAAGNGYVLAFDNVSALSPWLSDALCRLATGGGFATRALYTDQDEVLIVATRAAILNGIEDFVARSDLADRCIFIQLRPIAAGDRRAEAELNAEFEAKRPAILGALLDAMVHGLRQLPTIRLENPPRMADFAKWAMACEDAMFETGAFTDAYRRNRRAAVADVIDADPVADAVRRFMSTRSEWTGRAAALAEALEKLVGEKVAKSKAWPDNPRALRARLQRVQSPLRKIGAVITFVPGGRRNIIRISGTAPRPAPTARDVQRG